MQIFFFFPEQIFQLFPFSLFSLIYYLKFSWYMNKKYCIICCWFAALEMLCTAFTVNKIFLSLSHTSCICRRCLSFKKKTNQENRFFPVNLCLPSCVCLDGCWSFKETFPKKINFSQMKFAENE